MRRGESTRGTESSHVLWCAPISIGIITPLCCLYYLLFSLSFLCGSGSHFWQPFHFMGPTVCQLGALSMWSTQDPGHSFQLTLVSSSSSSTSPPFMLFFASQQPFFPSPGSPLLFLFFHRHKSSRRSNCIAVFADFSLIAGELFWCLFSLISPTYQIAFIPSLAISATFFALCALFPFQSL